MSRRADRAVEDAGKMRARGTSRKALRAQQQSRIEQAARLAAAKGNVREVLELTQGLPTDSSGTIFGPDGRPLLRPVVEDFTKLGAENEQDQVKLYAEDVLKRAARMQRDGSSLKQIAQALDVDQIVPLSMLDRALILGHQLLARDIALGVEPEESKIIVGYEALNPDGTPITDDTGDGITVEDSHRSAPIIVRRVPGDTGRPN